MTIHLIDLDSVATTMTGEFRAVGTYYVREDVGTVDDEEEIGKGETHIRRGRCVP